MKCVAMLKKIGQQASFSGRDADRSFTSNVITKQRVQNTNTVWFTPFPDYISHQYNNPIA